jgi:hypothetical protein
MRMKAESVRAMVTKVDLAGTLTTEELPVSQDTGARLTAGGSPDGVAPATVQSTVKPWMPAGAFRTDDHRYYFNGHGPVPGATSVLEILDKPALATWKAQQAVRAVIEHYEQWQSFSPDEIQKLALAEVRKTRDSSASMGTAVHHLADMVLRPPGSDPKGWKVDEGTQPYLDAYTAFVERYSASSFVSSEKMVWSLNGYGGTYDLLMMIDGQLWLIDIKTGKRIDYPEYRLQLAAYRWADSIILEGNPISYPMPNIERTGILHLRPDAGYPLGYRLWDIPITYESDYITFLGLLEAYKWKQQKVKPIAMT